MDETTESVEFVEGVLASALNTALRDLAGRGINLWVWEGGKPSKVTVQKQLTLLCGDTRAGGGLLHLKTKTTCGKLKHILKL